MPPAANARHTVALVLAALGGFGVFMAATTAVVAVVLAARDGRGGAGVFAPLVCSLVMTPPSVFLLRRGVAMRNRAIAAGSTLHNDGVLGGLGEQVHTTRTEAKQPSFLDKRRKEGGE